MTRPSSEPSVAPNSPGRSHPSAAQPSPSGPTPLPTLAPGYVAVLADKVVGNSNDGRPADLYGHVAIFYSDQQLVGDHAHWDGHQFMKVDGHAYVINRDRNSILYADSVVFDTLAQRAELANGRGESSQGVEKGLVYYTAHNIKSDVSGVAHGTYASLTTCARPRSGYHVTGRTIDVKPGDKITITKAVLFLGAAAIFYLPKLVIPLRTIDDERRRPQFFPELGYDQYEGFWAKARIGFGSDNFYYGYYRVEFFTKVGLGLGYVAAYAKRNGRRSGSVNFYGRSDKRTQSRTYNVQAQDLENISKTLKANLQVSYDSNFGPLSNLPPNTGVNFTLAHTGPRENQTYNYARSAIGSQSSTNQLGFNDTHTFRDNLTNTVAFSYTNSHAAYGGFLSDNSTAHVNDLVHWQTPGAQYQLVFDKNFAKNPFGVDKLPELQISPNSFFRHFLFPLNAQFLIGDYTEPQYHFNTARANATINIGPALLHIGRSDFSANETLNQFAYGTGDLKAAISQSATLSTPIGRHFVNNLNYSAQQYNGPSAVPFYTMDIQGTQNFKTAQDTLRIFNNDVYNLQLGFATNFNGQALPLTYRLMSRPSRQSYLQLSGNFIPGPGNGFPSTNVQAITELGIGGQLSFVGDIDWKNRGRIENKQIYYSRIIGECYEVFVQYNQPLRQVNVTLQILAFPSHAATFGLGAQGQGIIPSSFNGQF
ncbi:MAG: hypothetical protein M3Y18_02795 [Candidatus Eremiobacteraeota bacterium]|nr:hypothetical protein [Candidatus Eremiobacteraeota bacterium]